MDRERRQREVLLRRRLEIVEQEEAERAARPAPGKRQLRAGDRSRQRAARGTAQPPAGNRPVPIDALAPGKRPLTAALLPSIDELATRPDWDAVLHRGPMSGLPLDLRSRFASVDAATVTDRPGSVADDVEDADVVGSDDALSTEPS